MVRGCPFGDLFSRWGRSCSAYIYSNVSRDIRKCFRHSWLLKSGASSFHKACACLLCHNVRLRVIPLTAAAAMEIDANNQRCCWKRQRFLFVSKSKRNRFLLTFCLNSKRILFSNRMLVIRVCTMTRAMVICQRNTSELMIVTIVQVCSIMKEKNTIWFRARYMYTEVLAPAPRKHYIIGGVCAVTMTIIRLFFTGARKTVCIIFRICERNFYWIVRIIRMRIIGGYICERGIRVLVKAALSSPSHLKSCESIPPLPPSLEGFEINKKKTAYSSHSSLPSAFSSKEHTFFSLLG